MDAAKSDNLETEKKNNEEHFDYHSPNVSSGWQMNSSILESSSIGLIPQTVCKGGIMELASCSGASKVGSSYCPTDWDQPQDLGFCDINVQHSARATGLGPLGMNWNDTQYAMSRGGLFLPPVPGMLPQSLAQIPADSGFIERAARFSSFSNMMHPFSLPDPMNPCFGGGGTIQRPEEVSLGNGLKLKVSLPDDHGAKEGSPQKNEKMSERVVRSQDEEKQGGSDNAGFSGCGGRDEFEGAGGESSGEGPSSEKRKRIGQHTNVDNRGAPEPLNEVAKSDASAHQKDDQNTTSTTTKLGGKNGKPEAQNLDAPKEGYIHVRARRGQTTNSHSLAERVRREKISERMKFLQDLVPGCNKVTGRAVMLDEIINYVQSLQRQVEFLSMKLAMVNPRLNLNIEGLVGKDAQALPSSSSLAFPLDTTMQYPGLHLPPPGLIHVGLPASDGLQRSTSSQLANFAGGYRDSRSQVPGTWDDELHNIVQMGTNTAAPVSSQDLTASLSPDHMKADNDC